MRLIEIIEYISVCVFGLLALVMLAAIIFYGAYHLIMICVPCIALTVVSVMNILERKKSKPKTDN